MFIGTFGEGKGRRKNQVTVSFPKSQSLALVTTKLGKPSKISKQMRTKDWQEKGKGVFTRYTKGLDFAASTLSSVLLLIPLLRYAQRKKSLHTLEYRGTKGWTVP